MDSRLRGNDERKVGAGFKPARKKEIGVSLRFPTSREQALRD